MVKKLKEGFREGKEEFVYEAKEFANFWGKEMPQVAKDNWETIYKNFVPLYGVASALKRENTVSEQRYKKESNELSLEVKAGGSGVLYSVIAGATAFQAACFYDTASTLLNGTLRTNLPNSGLFPFSMVAWLMSSVVPMAINFGAEDGEKRLIKEKTIGLGAEQKILGADASSAIISKKAKFFDLDDCIYEGTSSHQALKLVPAEISKSKTERKDGHYMSSLKHAGNAVLGSASGVASYLSRYAAKPFVGEMGAENTGNSVLHWAMSKAGISSKDINEVITEKSIKKHVIKSAIGSIKAMQELNPGSEYFILTNAPSAFAEPIADYIGREVRIDGLICQETVYRNGKVKGLNLRMKLPKDRVEAVSKKSNLNDSVIFTNNGYDAIFSGKATLVSTEKAPRKLKLESDYHIPSWEDFEKVIRKL